MSVPAPARLPAAERRTAIVAAAARLFAEAGYRTATTAEIARRAGVSEPIIYRHFASKRDLYLACLDAGLDERRRQWEHVLASEPDPARWLTEMALAAGRATDAGSVVGDLWAQAIADAGGDREIRTEVAARMHDLQRFVAGVVVRGQELGGVDPALDPEIEAWSFVSIGLLVFVARRLAAPLAPEVRLGLLETLAARRSPKR